MSAFQSRCFDKVNFNLVSKNIINFYKNLIGYNLIMLISRRMKSNNIFRRYFKKPEKWRHYTRHKNIYSVWSSWQITGKITVPLNNNGKLNWQREIEKGGRFHLVIRMLGAKRLAQIISINFHGIYLGIFFGIKDDFILSRIQFCSIPWNFDIDVVFIENWLIQTSTSSVRLVSF